MDSERKKIWKKNKPIISLTILAIFIVSLYSVYYAQFYGENSISRLERASDNLRSKGIPIESISLDDEIGYLVVEFGDMKQQYIEPVREIIGYPVPVLFRKLESKQVLSGEPPAQLFELCNALNVLNENLDYLISADIDIEKGLLVLECRDLTDEIIQDVIGVVGDEVPIRFLERPCWDTVYIGEPSSDIGSLKAAGEKLDPSIQSGIRDIVVRTCIDESAGLLEVHLYDLDEYGTHIESIRNIVGNDIPLAFVLTRVKPPERASFVSADLLLNYYLSLLNLSDVGYEIQWQDGSEGEAAIYFLRDSDKVSFQILRLNKTGDSWKWIGVEKRGTASPSHDVEILGYLIRVLRSDGRKIVSRVTPMVKNHGNGTAYIWSVQVEITNATDVYHQTYLTVGMDLWNGLVDVGEIDLVDVGGSFDSLDILLDVLKGKTYTITIVLKDGEGNILDEGNFTHTFSKSHVDDSIQ